MKIYYHATSVRNALQIILNGFKLGKNGIFGSGIYFAEKPENALMKSHSPEINCIIIAVLNVGRLKNEPFPHSNWNLQMINCLGYDSVEMRNCRTGPEICIYEPQRVKIIGIVHWSKTDIVFNETTDLAIDLTAFNFLINSKTIKVEKSQIQL